MAEMFEENLCEIKKLLNVGTITTETTNEIAGHLDSLLHCLKSHDPNNSLDKSSNSLDKRMRNFRIAKVKSMTDGLKRVKNSFSGGDISQAEALVTLNWHLTVLKNLCIEVIIIVTIASVLIK